MALDAEAFTRFEQVAHDRIAGTYTEHFVPLTSLALEPLLASARVTAGQHVIDIATGPGGTAGAAAALGAHVVGIDVSPRMIELARTAKPGITFQVAEVTALPFADSSFDRALCNFGIGHFPIPEAALAECMRVLVPGGRLAFSWWDQPARQRVQGLFREVIAELSLSPPSDLPPGHDTLRYSDPEAFAALLQDAGLDEVTVLAHHTTHAMPDVEALWEAGMGGMAVTGSAIAAQDAATQSRARQALSRRVEIYRSPRGLDIPIAFLIGAGRKPG